MLRNDRRYPRFMAAEIHPLLYQVLHECAYFSGGSFPPRHRLRLAFRGWCGGADKLADIVNGYALRVRCMTLSLVAIIASRLMN